jgi:hypothetical protein
MSQPTVKPQLLMAELANREQLGLKTHTLRVSCWEESVTWYSLTAAKLRSCSSDDTPVKTDGSSALFVPTS